MSGATELYIQPSRLPSPPVGSLAPDAGGWVRGIPGAGTATIPAVAGVASCRNLLQNSPPTLLEAYELVAYRIGFGLYSGGSAAAPNLVAELAFLVNDRVRHVETIGGLAQNIGAATWVLSGVWTADLVNPIRLGARDRLSLRAGVHSDQATSAQGAVLVGVQVANDGSALPYESTISYQVLDVPAVRQL